ncbi:hypothetical protein [Rossellomorea aquimaris]|uniref:Uncharacterized protein n=1 Tax=Rossellomorea aquimaris TaxID=189382 RepID=A0A366EK70_9BACI|nr:hypothetical protein [Rossellomorea aquimaris]RBP02793.1 hypothetical protein DET59_11280 [Rossellomorea aquimaris]
MKLRISTLANDEKVAPTKPSDSTSDIRKSSKTTAQSLAGEMEKSLLSTSYAVQ